MTNDESFQATTLAGFRLEVMAELAFAALAGSDPWEMQERFRRRASDVLQGLQYMRVDRHVLPDWWLRRLSPEQVDGRVRILGVHLNVIELTTFDDSMFTLTMHTFVEALLEGHVLDSQ